MELRRNVLDCWAIDNVDVGIGHLLHAHRSGLLEHALVDQRHVLHIDTQTRDAVVDVHDVVDAIQVFNDVGERGSWCLLQPLQNRPVHRS